MPRLQVTALLAVVASSFVLADEPAKPAETPGAVTVDNAGQGTPYRLVYKFTTGQFAHFESTTNSTFITRFPSQDPNQNKNTEVILQQKATNQTQTWKQFRVLSVDEDGLATLEPIITRVKMSAAIDNIAANYDSAVDQDPSPQFAPVAQSIGKPLARVVFGPNGELVKMTMLQGAPNKLAEPAAKADPVLNFLVVLPKEPVGVGAIWRDRFQVPVTVGNGLNQLVSLQRQYTLTKVDGSIATIASRTSILTPISDPLLEAQLMQRTTTGTIEFDLERGLVVSQSASVDQQVVGAAGPKTVVHATSNSRERLLAGPAGVQPAALRE